MSARNTFCCINAESYSGIPITCNQRPTWYTKLVKPFTFCIIASMLVISLFHLCEKYSASISFKMVKADLENLKSHLETLSLEVKNLIEIRNEMQSKLKEVDCMTPKLSETIKLQNEASDDVNNIETILHKKNLLKDLSSETIKNLVKSELEMYDADKTGRTDYALETSGGEILSTRNTEFYSTGTSVFNLFGTPRCQQQNNPQAVIQTSILPGECWAFKGSSGSVVIRLLGYVHVSGFSLEHISPLISPTGETGTAPRDFSVWGLTDLKDKMPFLFGEFTYDNADSPLQYFEVQNRAIQPYEIIEVKINSNSGSPEYTCIYRIRVHGTLVRGQL